MILIGTLIPFFGSMVYLLNLSPIKGLDVIHFTFILAGILYALTIFRFRFLDIIPVARSTVVENISDGILVLDINRRIADLNPAAEKVLGVTKTTALGQPLDKIWPQLELTLANLDFGHHTELAYEAPGTERIFDISKDHLSDSHGSPIGQLIMFRDITERKQTQSKLEALYQEERRLSLSLQEEEEKYGLKATPARALLLVLPYPYLPINENFVVTLISIT